MKSHRSQCAALIIGCALPVLLLLGLAFTGQKDISETENRALTRFPAFSVSSFVSGDFQADLESALGDQYTLGDSIKHMILSAKNAVTQAETGLLRFLFPEAASAYAEIIPGYFHFNGDGRRIVERPRLETDLSSRLQRNAEQFNAAQGVNKYIYMVRNSRAQDFSLSQEANAAAFQAVKAAYRADGYGCLEAKDYQEYCELFYQTDHHWNHRGADRGYREILALLGVEEAPFSPEKEWRFDVVFNGSYARQTKLLCADECFAAYSYPIPALKTVLSGKKGLYGHQSLYEKNRFPTDELRNHYAYYYGGDYGEILIDNGVSRGRNLLLIADSYSNPINLLLASHFDQTCVIDLRYYEQDMGKQFSLDSYIREHGITDVLMLGDITLFLGSQEEEANR